MSLSRRRRRAQRRPEQIKSFIIWTASAPEPARVFAAIFEARSKNEQLVFRTWATSTQAEGRRSALALISVRMCSELTRITVKHAFKFKLILLSLNERERESSTFRGTKWGNTLLLASGTGSWCRKRLRAEAGLRVGWTIRCFDYCVERVKVLLTG